MKRTAPNCLSPNRYLYILSRYLAHGEMTYLTGPSMANLATNEGGGGEGEGEGEGGMEVINL